MFSTLQTGFFRLLLQVIACTEPVWEGEFREEDVAALYLAADAALVSTVFDGLNLFPYEFTASQRPDDPASLIISEFMGCSRSLSGAIRVNPWYALFCS